MCHSITSLHHPLVKHLVKLQNDNDYRHHNQKVVLDGLKPVQEVSSYITKLLFTKEYASYASSLPGEKWEVTEGILHKISGMVSPEGILAEVQMPHFGSLDKAKKVLALDALNDPGNLGTLMRTALALGWDAVFLLPGTCDPFNKKVIRAARGAQFKITLIKGTSDELCQWGEKNGVQSIVADLKGKSPELLTPAKKRLLVLGNEAHGASDKIHQFCSPVTIPMPGEMESLNVAIAGGILLYFLSDIKRGL